MKRTRVALIFSGQPRCIDGISYEGFRKCILEQYDVDVYAHFWGEVESDKSVGSASMNLERFKELYRPKAVQVDPPLLATEYPMAFIQPHSPLPLTLENLLAIKPEHSWGYWVRNCVSMYTSMNRAYDVFLANKQSDYDWIIRTRTDCVMLRCPRLDHLDPQYMYVPDWHGPASRSIVNHALIIPPSLAEPIFRIRNTLEGLRGCQDEDYMYNNLWHLGLFDKVRRLPKPYVFYPTLTRDGVNTDQAEPDMTCEIVEPPYALIQIPKP